MKVDVIENDFKAAPKAVAQEVLSVEITGLSALSKAFEAGPLQSSFAEAVKACRDLKGRVIVTGMGKSGHIARKIAATLASTGTPASYVHPGEASHGDLGMISQDDVVLALSNSGETPELGDILGYTSRFEITLIGMTSGPASTLAEASDILLLIPRSVEACGITKAPTTSTTQMIALGDALAVAVLRERGFTATDFHKFHPGGKLGAALKRVTDLMHHKNMPLCRPEDPVAVAVQQITEAGFGCTGVVDEAGKLIGIVTDGDLRRHFSQALNDETVADIMTPEPRTVEEGSLAAEALSLLTENKITALFILNGDGVPVGLLHVHDCLAVGVV
ncbi:MAG: KpsF/GutQ family sugar-phosphate isomerase [Henriciella sp.]